MSKRYTRKPPMRLKSDMSNLAEFIAHYTIDYDALLADIGVRGKTMGDALSDQVDRPMKYELAKAEIKSAIKMLMMQRDKLHAAILQKSIESYPYEISDRAREKYITGSEPYLLFTEYLIQLEELHDQYSSVIESFKLRGFALRDKTTLLVNAMNDFVV